MTAIVEVQRGRRKGRDDPCAELATEADRQCLAAVTAQQAAQALADRLATARLDHGAHLQALEAASAGHDPAAIRAWRKRARAAFQEARGRARTTDDLAVAAEAWLAEVERLNGVAAEVANRVERERAATEIAAAVLDRLALEWQSAQAVAEAADAACLASRRAEVDCDPMPVGGASAGQALATAAIDAGATVKDVDGQAAPGQPRPLGAIPAHAGPARLGPDAVICRMLAGDVGRLGPIVAQLAVDDDDARRWQTRLVDLLETILLRAVDATAVAMPSGHPFWGAFTAEQSGDILAALAALGYHFDGLGGWLDDHVPNQRDLSIAVAHAGLDPMRIRHWPTPEECAELVRHVDILGADYLREIAPSLTVRELTAVLGQEGGRLDEVWREWDRIRPLLMATD